MKAQPLKLLTVGLITLVVLSPALLVWWRIYQYHSAFAHVQRVVLSTDLTMLYQTTIAIPHYGEFSLIDASKALLKAIASVLTPLAFFSFMVTVPIGFWVGLWLSDRYQTRRNTALKQQVATLERLWQESIY